MPAMTMAARFALLITLLVGSSGFSPASPRRKRCNGIRIVLNPQHRRVNWNSDGLGTKTQLRVSVDQVPQGGPSNDLKDSWATLAGIGAIGFLYWYWLVLGAAAKANGLPGVPDFLPMIPGWPPSEADLQGPLDDAYHFFYLSELIGNEDAPYAPPVRLAVYNIAEAWIFAMLPLLWKDSRRLPRPALFGLWSILGINLTNAFLAPYLFFTGAFVAQSEEVREKNQIVSKAMGTIASLVAGYAVFETATTTNVQDWINFANDCKVDRTYFAFVVDLALFSLLQPYIIGRVEGENKAPDFVPFVGLMTRLFR